MFPITAGLGALSYLTSLLQSSASHGSTSNNALTQLANTLDGNQSPTTSNPPASSGTQPAFDSGMLASLLSLQSQQSGGTTGKSGLFSQLDTDGDGQISKTDFESALSADGVDTSSADALFSKLDTNKDGVVSPSELRAARHGHHHGGGGMGLSSLMNSLNPAGANTQTATNADGSTTTTITYADGSTVSMTAPGTTSSSSGSGSTGSGPATASANNLIEQLIKLQSQYLAQSTSSLSTVA